MGLHQSESNLEVAKRENSSILLEDNYEERYDGFDPNSPESQIMFSLYQSAYIDNSLNLASKIEQQFKTRVGRHSRGVKQAGFIVLYKTAMPSVLVEVGFLSNPKEEQDLNNDLQQTYIASGIFRAFRDYKNELETRN
jgi:N-acetylmuramoyl-L-alanine amidase